MSAEQRPPRDEIARLGDAAVERFVRPNLRPGDDGKYIAIDIYSGEYELDEDDIAAITRLTERVAKAEVWLARAGFPAAYLIRRAS